MHYVTLFGNHKILDITDTLPYYSNRDPAALLFEDDNLDASTNTLFLKSTNFLQEQVRNI